MYTADAVTRGDFANQVLLDERAYIASWMARTRDLWRYVGLSAYAVTQQPSTKFETDYGVDAIVVIEVRGRMKFFAFEAKRPGLGTPRVFDRKPKAKAIWSRFSRQIMRQAALQKMGWVTGALFLDERFQNTSWFDPLGSIFVPHQHLVPMLGMKVGKAWVTNDVCPLARSHGLDVKSVMERLVNCSDGFPTEANRVEEMLANLRSKKYEPTDLEREMYPEPEEPEEPPIFGAPDSFKISRYVSVPTIIERNPRATSQEQLLSNALQITGASHGVMFVVADHEVEPDLWGNWVRPRDPQGY